MTSTSDKKLARAIVDRHEDVKYTEALRFVAQLKEMRERNESRTAFGATPVIEVDPMGPRWKFDETRRFFSTESGSTFLPASVSVRGEISDSAEARECIRESQAKLGERKVAGRESAGGVLMLDEWHMVANAEKRGRLFEGAMRATGAVSDRERVAERLQTRMRELTQSVSDFTPRPGNTGAEKRSHFLKLQLEMARRGRSIYVTDPKAGGLPDTSGPNPEA